MYQAMIRIDDILIRPEHIIAIELNAILYSEVDKGYHSGVRISLLGIDTDKSIIMSDGKNKREPKVLTYHGAQAEALRPWLVEMFPCEGRSIRLPEAVAIG